AEDLQRAPLHVGALLEQSVGGDLTRRGEPAEEAELDVLRGAGDLVEELAQRLQRRPILSVARERLVGRLGRRVPRPQLAQEDELELEDLVAGRVEGHLFEVYLRG